MNHLWPCACRTTAGARPAPQAALLPLQHLDYVSHAQRARYRGRGPRRASTARQACTRTPLEGTSATRARQVGHHACKSHLLRAWCMRGKQPKKAPHLHLMSMWVRVCSVPCLGAAKCQFWLAHEFCPHVHACATPPQHLPTHCIPPVLHTSPMTSLLPVLLHPPAGSFSAAGASTCTKCPAGQYQPALNATACIACPIDTWAPKTGYSTCRWGARGAAA